MGVVRKATLVRIEQLFGYPLFCKTYIHEKKHRQKQFFRNNNSNNNERTDERTYVRTENKIAHLSFFHSWKDSIGPCVVSAEKSGTMLPRRKVPSVAPSGYKLMYIFVPVSIVSMVDDDDDDVAS